MKTDQKSRDGLCKYLKSVGFETVEKDKLYFILRKNLASYIDAQVLIPLYDKNVSLDIEMQIPGVVTTVHSKTLLSDYDIPNFKKAYAKGISKVNEAIQAISKTGELSDKLD